jgi:xanthine/uracil permease
MNNDNPFKNLFYLIGAVVLLLIGLLVLFKILIAVVPWILIGGAIYLIFRWFQHKRFGR